MPVIQIQALPQQAGVDIQGTIKNIATSVASIVGVPSSAVFCTWTEINPNFYTEGDATASVQPDATHPPIVQFTLFEGRPPELIEKALEAIAHQLQTGLGHSSPNAFITCRVAKSGTIFTGGKIKR